MLSSTHGVFAAIRKMRMEWVRHPSGEEPNTLADHLGFIRYHLDCVTRSPADQEMRWCVLRVLVAGVLCLEEFGVPEE